MVEKRKGCDRRQYNIDIAHERRKTERRRFENCEKNKKKGFILVCRSFLEWEWYKDVNVTKVFIHCLFRANFKDKKWKGILVPQGTFITAYSALSAECGVSIQKVRTSLRKLIKTNELELISNTKYTIIKVINYKKYQKKEKNQ